jgi:hypothetical protein
MKYLIMILYGAGCVWALSTLESCKTDEQPASLSRTDLLTNRSSRAWHLEGVRPAADAPETRPACQADDKMWFAKDGTWRHDNGNTPCDAADRDTTARWAFVEGETAVRIEALNRVYGIVRLESRLLELSDAQGRIWRYSCGCSR